MSFFTEEILENIDIKEIVRNNKKMREMAGPIARDIIATGKCPTLDRGLLPVFVLAELSDYVLEKNIKAGIDRDITVATLKDINLWLDNYYTQYGEYGLAEFEWLFYHYTGDLFNLGRLQFRIEKARDYIPSGKYVIETHVPQGKPLDIEECIKSFDRAKEFFKDCSPQYFMCESWLLNPNLEKILDSNSNIVKFNKLWNKAPIPSDNSAQAIERVFGFGYTIDDIDKFPETSSLQRALKSYLKEGGSIDDTGGFIKI